MEEFIEPGGKRHALIRYIAASEIMGKRVGVTFWKLVETLAISLLAGSVRRGDAYLEELLGVSGSW
jgi:hypothetical protein